MKRSFPVLSVIFLAPVLVLMTGLAFSLQGMAACTQAVRAEAQRAFPAQTTPPAQTTLLVQTTHPVPRAGERPNIVLIVADDLGYGDLGCYGQRQIKTPHLDSLAASGMKFTDFYSGSTVCAPSRDALLTGMHTGHTYIKGNFDTGYPEGDLAIPASRRTMAEYLSDAGYRTAIIGKWGLGGPRSGPNTQGFDYSLCYLDQISAHNYYPPHLYENEQLLPLSGNQNGRKTIYSHDVFVERTLNYIAAAGSQPFFLYLPYTIPHGKHVIPDDAPYSAEEWPQNFKNYAAMITRLDRDIGRIVQALKAEGMDRNTLILFTSDNGANRAFAEFFKSNGSFRGAKRDLYEGGIRVPLIAFWPGRITPGTVCSEPGAAWDLLPTLCEIAGAGRPVGIDGISLLSELVDPAVKGRKSLKEPDAAGRRKTAKERTTGEEQRFLYWEYYAYNWNYEKPDNKRPRNWLESQAVRYGKWKAVRKGLWEDPEAQTELYDLHADTAEERNVAARQPELVRKLEGFFKKASRTSPYFPHADSLHVLDINTPAELKDFFHYTPESIPFVSAHRGGARPGFPENCIATFENTLRHTHAILEVDPRYTRDSVIVLMHDPTLDRTTTGTGKVADHTWEELKKLKLKDPEGRITPYRIPTLAEALEWAKGKTVLVLDQKDVPMEARAQAVSEQNAEANAVLIVYSYEDARRCYALNKNLVMEVMVPDASKAAEFEATGVPWENVIAFVGHKKPEDSRIYKLIHGKGTMCIVGSSRIYDHEYLAGDKDVYRELVNEGADIIEADLGVEAGSELERLAPAASPEKAGYFYILK